MKVVVSGATGFLGHALVETLSTRGDQVVVLTRHPQGSSARTLSSLSFVEARDWSNANEAVASCDAVVNLAGEPIMAGRWTPARKEAIRSSRVKATESIVADLQAAPVRPRVLVNASGLGYYGWHDDEEITEASPAGSDFLASVCSDWEKAATSRNVPELRRVLIRTGIVFGRGGALEQMTKPFRLFAGGPLGSGQQWVSWIHIRDVVGLILFALDHSDIEGPLNLTAPNPVRNKELAHLIGKTLRRPSFMPTPAIALRVALGESADAILTGQRVLPAKALAAGYRFQFSDCAAALTNVLQ